MAQRFYPAVLERGEKATFAVWFPDLPGAVAASRTQEEAMAKAHEALKQALLELSERNQPLPDPTPFEKVEIPKDCELITLVALGAEPPNPSERVNIYLPRKLLEKVDQCASDMGMSRSSFFGFAANIALEHRTFAIGGQTVPRETLRKMRSEMSVRKKRPKA